MNSFDLPKISQLTEAFITRNQRLGYHLDKLEEDGRHVLYQATNLFSQLYCQITTDIDLIGEWPHLQEELFKQDRSKANRYLVYVVPDSLIRQSHLYEELTRAERDDKFFRKVFIGLPDRAGKKEVENSLADRIPLWFEERNEVIRQYVPVVSEFIPDADLLKILTQNTPSSVVKTIGEQPQFAYLLEGKARQPEEAKGLEESKQIKAGNRGGTRITGLNVQDFRRFQKRSIDLDGDVVLVYGRNGTGKTTLCDALELSIFPELRRLHGDPDLTEEAGRNTPFVRAGSHAECARISVSGNNGDEHFLLETTVTSKATVKSLNGKPVTSDEVVRFLTRNENVQKKGFLDILLHTHFLGQHSIRDFIYGNRLDDDEKITTTRYNLLAEMFGFGEVEQLKKRLTSVLSQIKRSKITDAENEIETAMRQVRGLQQKYGPKCRLDLEKKGYEIAPEYAVGRYDRVIHRLGESFGQNFVKQIIVAQPPMENYTASCDTIHSLLSAQMKTLEGQAADLKQLGRLIAKLNAIFPEIGFLNTGMIKTSLEEARRKIDSILEATEVARREVQKTDSNIKSVDASITPLRQFLERHDHYLGLLETERKEVESFNALQGRRNELLEKQSGLLVRLQEATEKELATTRLLAEAEQRGQIYERLREFLPDAKSAQLALQQQASRIGIINAAIAQAEDRLKQLSQQASVHGHALPDALLDVELLRTNDQFTCPCCGANYDEQTKIELGIKNQISHGRYPQELRAFLASLEKRNVETARAHILGTISSYNREKAELEQNTRVQTKILTTFRQLANGLGLTEESSEDRLRELMQKLERETVKLKETLASHGVKSLKDESAKIQADLATLKDDVHKKHLTRIRSEIAEITRAVTGILSSEQLQDRKQIQARLDTLTTQLLGHAKQKDQLLDEIKTKNIPQERLREIDECIDEIESLLLSQQSFQSYAPNISSNLGNENLERQRMCHELSSEALELGRLFGLLTAEERGETLRSVLKEYEKEKSRWTVCYQTIDKMNTDLSKLTNTGLQESLAQYGPLINQIYQKFIRHDIFASLVLQSSSSQKARRRDLYLRLKSYSGETEFTPASYLSEAQLNILALSIFLTRVMYQNISELETVLIDDPIQQMDDMNSAAFVDVILGLSQIGKQIIITTCNQDFYRLVAHKMQSISTSGRISFKSVNLDAPGTT